MLGEGEVSGGDLLALGMRVEEDYEGVFRDEPPPEFVREETRVGAHSLTSVERDERVVEPHEQALLVLCDWAVVREELLGFVACWRQRVHEVHDGVRAHVAIDDEFQDFLEQLHVLSF